MTNSELRDAAAKALGWHEQWRIIDPRCPSQRAYYDERQEFRCTVANFTPDTDANQLALLLAEVELRGRRKQYLGALAVIINIRIGYSMVREEFVVPERELWLIVNATPEQKTRAAITALGENGGGE